MKAIHPALQRLLDRHFGSGFAVPTEWRGFITEINETYRGFNSDGLTVGPSLDPHANGLSADKPKTPIVLDEIPHAQGALLRAAVEESTDAIIITDTNLDLPGPRILFVNPAFTAITGYSAAEVIGKTPRILQGAKSDRATLRRLRATLARGGTFAGETVNYRKDGTDYYQEWQVTPLHDSHGAITHFLGIQRDVTARKQTEAALQKSEAQFRTLAKLSPVGIFQSDPEGLATYWNEKLCEITGMSVAEARGTGWINGIHPDDRQPVFEEWNRRCRERRPFKMQYRFVHKDGAVVWTIGEATAILDAAGSVTGYVGTISDITELKQAETKLAEASGLLDAMLENSPDLIYFKDRESRFVRVSRSFLSRAGVTESALLGKTDADVYADVHAETALADEQEIIRTGQPLLGKLEREIHSDGRVTWVLTTKMCWRDGTGAIVGTFGISRDVTALKEAEEKLAYERDQLRALLDAVPDAIYFKDTESRFVLVSRSKLQSALMHVPDLRSRRIALGLSADVPDTDLLIGLTDFDTFREEVARVAHEEELQIIRTGEPLIGKLSHQTFVDGRAHWWLTSKMPWRDRNGTIIGTFGISKDLTDLKEAEAALEKANRDLIEASRIAGMAEVAIYVLHTIGNVLNSINISAALLTDRTLHSQLGNLSKLSTLLQEHQSDLAAFLMNDARGEKIPVFLAAVVDQMKMEQTTTLQELENLRKHVDLISLTIAEQQKLVRASRVTEAVSLVDVADEALRSLAPRALASASYEIVREYQGNPTVNVERHKILQILINLIQNAKDACDDSDRKDKRIIVRVTTDAISAKVSIIDNGVGVARENLTRIFAHGFTTKDDTHGFGLHRCANAATELGGSLTVRSDGIGQGATFILEIPFPRPTT